MKLLPYLELNRFDDNYRGMKEHGYSIQNVAVEGLKYGKLPGDWYGVGAISNIIETLTERYEPVANFKICVFQEGNIILEDIESRATPLS
jgi:Peptidase family C54